MVFDLLVTALITTVALAVLLPNAAPARLKAKFVEVLYAMATERATLIERHAHTGAWTESDVHRTAQGAPPGSDRAYRVNTADGSVVAAGMLAGRTFVAGMRPAVAAPIAHWSVLWLCGERRAPAGWSIPPRAIELDLPDDLALSVCRAEKKT